MLGKGGHPKICMNNQKGFNKTTLATKEEIYRNLIMEDITDENYKHAKRVWRDIKLQNLGDYLDLCNQSYTLLLADLFKKFRKNCIETMNLILFSFFQHQDLYVSHNQNRQKQNQNCELMVEEGIKSGVCHAFNQYSKANNKYMKDHNKSKTPSDLMYWDANNLYGRATSQKIPSLSLMKIS